MAGADGNVSKHSWKTELQSSEVAAAAAPPDELWPRKQGGGESQHRADRLVQTSIRRGK